MLVFGVAVASIVTATSVGVASASVLVTATIPLPSTSGLPQPVAVAVDSTTGRGYVADYRGGSVTVFDTRSPRVLTTLPHGPADIGTGPSAIALDPSTRNGYVTNSSSATVSVIDLDLMRVKTVIPYSAGLGIGAGPSAVAIDPDEHRAYVTNRFDDTVSVIDTSTNSVVSVIAFDPAQGIGRNPTDVAVDTSSHLALVTNRTDSTVSVIDTTRDVVVRVIPHDSRSGIGDTPADIAIDSSRHLAMVIDTGDSTATILDTQDASTAVLARIPHDSAAGIGDSPIAVDMDVVAGQALILTEQQLTSIDLTSRRVTRVQHRSAGAEFGTTVTDITTDPEHRKAYVTGATSQTVSVLALDAMAPVVRRGGADRYEVSARSSAAEFAPGAAVAYVASGAAFADALSAAASAGARRAPVLLTAADTIPTAIGAELARLKPQRIVVLGGTTSVSSPVEAALHSYAPVVDRLGGVDRYAVSAAVSHDTFTPGIPVAYLASGAVFPDALSGSAVAASNGGPVLLTTRDAAPQATLDELARLKPGRIVILGGTDTVSATVENQVKAAAATVRVDGADRFEVSANASASTFSSANVAYIASGVVFPDALSGSPAAAANGAPVLLVGKDAIPAPVARELARLAPAQIVVLGGPNTVSDHVFEQLRGYLR